MNVRYPLKVTVAKEAWPLTVPYEFISWDSLPQKDSRSFVDLVGRVLEKPVSDANSTIPKMIVTLCNGDLKQNVHFLGQHAGVPLQVGDLVAMAGAHISEWRGERSLETNFLTIVDVNPRHHGDLFGAPDIDGLQWKRKAMRLTSHNVLRIAEVKTQMDALLAAAPTEEQKEFMLVGRLVALSEDFFELDPPIVGGDRQGEMCWQTFADDPTGRIAVKVWDKVCVDLFHATAVQLRELWEEGNAHVGRRNDILDSLSSELQYEARAACVGRVWTYGARKDKQSVQGNINAVEICPE